MMAQHPRIVAELGRPETPDETASRKAESSRVYRASQNTRNLIVADGDGVIVVPRAHALEVARYAHKVIEGDKKGRRGLYKELGLPEDASVR